jgi:signal transduction histidine kinase
MPNDSGIDERDAPCRQKVEIHFTSDDIPSPVPHEISLCLFRVLQEALYSATKHSQVRHFRCDPRLLAR